MSKAILGTAVVIASLAVLPSQADARSRQKNLVLLLAQQTVAEIGFVETYDDAMEAQVMWSILDYHRRLSGASFETVIRQYNSAFRCEGKACDSDRARWVRNLKFDGSKPDGWDDNRASWKTHRKLWMNMLDDAHLWLAAGRPHPYAEGHTCRFANHYGGDMDDPASPCWILIYCGETKQTYWNANRCRS